MAPGHTSCIAVTDTGVGMSREVMRAASFEPFFTTKEIGQGTGLGLSQVYGFVKQSGGHVKLYSELGEGTTVKHLPAAPARRATRTPARRAAPSATAARRPVRTILVVEDDDDVRAHSSRDPERARLSRAARRPTARPRSRSSTGRPEIELLFTDVGLPGGMNGRQLADEACRRRPDLQVLFTTGYARNAIVHDGRLDPGVQLITKPFTYAGLAAKVRDLLEREAAPPLRPGGRGRGAGAHRHGRSTPRSRLPGRGGRLGDRGPRQSACWPAGSMR